MVAESTHKISLCAHLNNIFLILANVLKQKTLGFAYFPLGFATYIPFLASKCFFVCLFFFYFAASIECISRLKILCQLFLVASMNYSEYLVHHNIEMEVYLPLLTMLRVDLKGSLSPPLPLFYIFSSPLDNLLFLLLSAPYQLFPELYLFITFLWLLKQLDPRIWCKRTRLFSYSSGPQKFEIRFTG